MTNATYYAEKELSNLWEENGAFFAFSQSQFDEAAEEGIRYKTLRSIGLYIPVDNVATVLNGMKAIQKNKIERDIKGNSLRSIIIRELYNYECFYTLDYSNALEALEPYGVTEEQVYKIFREEMENIDFDNY